VITNAYRAAIDAFYRGEPCPEWALREVVCVSHRHYCTGFYFGEQDLQHYEQSSYIRNCDFVGVIDSYQDGVAEITQRNYFKQDDELEVVIPNKPPQRLIIDEMYNSKGEAVTVANHAVEKLTLRCRLSVTDSQLLIRRHENK
jgi:putative protease